jgi:bifunctional non-homologous end joining protein LigD
MPIDPLTYAPMLAGTSQDVPRGDAWRFEIKWDGFRAIARVQGDDVRLWSRNGKTLEAKHRSSPSPARRAHALRLRARRRAVRVRRDGVPRFELFQRGEGAIAYVVFDLLELDGEP